MRMSTNLLRGLLILAAALPCAAAEFRNLGFDDADLSGVVTIDGLGPTEKLLPAWTLLADSIPTDRIGLDMWFLDTPLASLKSTLFSEVGAGPYAVEFFRETTNSPIWRIQQIGTVPIGTEYLAYSFAGFEMSVQIDGQSIPPLYLLGSVPSPFGAGGPTNLVYRVSGFAGREAQLAFVGPFGPQPTIGSANAAFCYLDSVRFISAAPTLAVSRSKTNLVL